MAETHVIGALRHKRAELAGMLRQLEQQLVQQRANLTHVDATMRLFDQISGQRTSVRSSCGRATHGFVRVSACG